MTDGGRVLVAFSGGVDSSVMLDVIIRLRDELSVSVCAAHLNHMLRGEDSDSDEAFAGEKCKAYGIDFISERINIAEMAEKTGESVELCARNARYDFLRRAKESLGASHIATAHNANDNLETILLNLTRGGGLDGLCGIPPVRGDIIRPLIECTRAEIEEYAKREKITFCIDKTNEGTQYSRNKLRHLAVPTLLDLNASAVENASRTSVILREEATFLMKAARKHSEKISRGLSSCDRKGLLSEPALMSRVCEIFAANALGKDSYTLEYRHVGMISSLAKSESPSCRISLPGGLLVSRIYDEVLFERETSEEELPPVLLQCGENFWGEYVINVKKSEKREKIHNLLNTFFVPYDKIQDNLVVRSRKEGDEIKLPKRRTKSIKKLFIDEKLPLRLRSKTPVIADGEKVFGVFGFGEDVRFFSDSEHGYFIEINKK